jgi:hypothetical protein
LHNIALSLFHKHNAATTVATTINIASKVGIKIFATGGIGGVHLGSENNSDISADLTELSRNRMFVISSGAKSILDLEKTFETTVGVVIDDVFAASNSGVDLDLFDLEQVEILRGPQGTLFGRNTIGGVINIRRSKPTREFGVKVKLDLEEDNTNDSKLIINTPLGDNGGLKVSLRRLQSDSFMFNVTRNEREKNRDLTSASVVLDFDPI